MSTRRVVASWTFPALLAVGLLILAACDDRAVKREPIGPTAQGAVGGDTTQITDPAGLIVVSAPTTIGTTAAVTASSTGAPSTVGQTTTSQAATTAPAVTSAGPSAEVQASTCAQSDVQSAIDRSGPGSTVQVPAGTCSWSGLRLDRAVHLEGAGVGQTVIAAVDNTVTKRSDGVIRVSGFTFERSGGGNSSKAFIVDGSWRGAEPVVFEHNEFKVRGSGLFGVEVPGGVIFSANRFEGGWDDSFIQLASHNDSESWTSDDTLGRRDAAGRLNTYIEDNTFLGGTNQAIDCDAAARCVYRYNSATYSSFNTHGRSTSPQSLRHFEVYGNRFLHLGTDAQIGNQNWAIWIRGGTGVIFDNQFDDIAGSHWGDKSEIFFSVRGAEDPRPQGSCATTTYPVPQQLGQSYRGGRAITDPIHLWGNTGTVGISAGWNWDNPCGFDFDRFFRWGRDGIDGTARPGYTPFTYPHPLATAVG